MHDPNAHREVQLEIAFQWKCPDCLETNFALPIEPDLDEETAEEMYREMHDLEPWSTLPDNWRQFKLKMIPDIVECWNCDAPFLATDNSEESDDL